MSTNAPRPERPFYGAPTVSPSPAPPPKQLGTMRIVTDNTETLVNAAARIQELEADLKYTREKLQEQMAYNHRIMGNSVSVLKENKGLRETVSTLRETLEAWQAVVRVAREKDSTLPDPESPSVP